MAKYSTKKHIVEMSEGLGSVWIVRVFRKRPFLKKLVSSDWFLDGDQARRFVDQLLPVLDEYETAALLATRKPGWVLRQAAR